MKIILVTGARPNFMKVAPIAAELHRYPDEFQVVVVHTGQHYDYALSQVFFDELQLSSPDYHLDAVHTNGAAAQVGDIIAKFGAVLADEKPDLVMVVGDVSSSLACATAAALEDLAIGHVEAGLRSGDRRLPEEVYRVAIDALADLHFTYSQDADSNLVAENVPRRCLFRVGNLMIDTLERFRPRAAESAILQSLDLAPGQYGVVTLHRQSNVDNADTLRGILEALGEIQQRLPLVFPVHPRTRANLERFELTAMLDEMAQLRLIEPLGYIDMLALMSSAAMVLVDSGGIQEETTVLGVACLTLRDSTERPITITEGTNTLVGSNRERIVVEATRVLDDGAPEGRIPEFWDGHSAERLVGVLREHGAKRR